MSEYPSGWRIETIGDTCDIHDSKRIPLSSEQRRDRKGPYPYYGANNIQDSIDDFIFDFDAVLLAEDGGYYDEYETRDIAQYATGRYWVNNHAHILTGRECLDTRFLYFTLVRKNICPWINTGTRAKLNQADLRQIEIAVPPLPEQKKIAEILSGIDKCIAETRTIKEKIRATSKAIQDEFVLATVSGKTKQSFADLGSIADIRGRIGWKGYTKEDLVESGALVLGGTQISKDNQIDLSKPVFISASKYRESPEIMVNPGDLILVKTGNTIGKIALVPNWNQEATINPNTVIIRAKYPLNQYLLFALSSECYQRKLWDLVAVGAQPSVNQSNLKAIAIPIPAEEEMIALSEQFASLNRMKRIAEAKAIKLQYLKNAVSSDLLSGRKRVIV